MGIFFVGQILCYSMAKIASAINIFPPPPIMLYSLHFKNWRGVGDIMKWAQQYVSIIPAACRPFHCVPLALTYTNS
jgi:hypothetical protein